MITLRPAVGADISLILRFIGAKAEFDGAAGSVRMTAEKLEEALFAEPPLVHVVLAESEGRAIGFASYDFTYSTFLARPSIWLDDLFVAEDMRSRGVGRAMLVFLARLAREKGCGRIEWTAAASNERALSFYQRAGAAIRDRTFLCRLDATAIADLALDRGTSPG